MKNDKKNRPYEMPFWSSGVGWRDELSEFLWVLFAGVVGLVLPFGTCLVWWYS